MTYRKFSLTTTGLVLILILAGSFVILMKHTGKTFKQISTATTLSFSNYQSSGENQEAPTPAVLVSQTLISATNAAITEPSKATIVKPLPSPKLSDGAEFRLPIHNPKFSPFSERYLFTALVNSAPSGLWLASLSRGVEKELVATGGVGFAWGYDDNHIIYSPLPDFNNPPLMAQPVILVSLESGEQTEIGQSTLGWGVAVAPTGDIALMNGEHVEIVNTISGVKRIVPDALSIGVSVEPTPMSTSELAKTPEPIPDFLQPATAPLTVTVIPSPSCLYPDCQIRMHISSDGTKLALHQLVPSRSTLVIVEIDTQKSVFVSDQIAGWYSFDWSSDSQKLAYAIQPPNTRTPELWIVNADGSDLRQVAYAKDRRGLYEYVTWLPNNQAILYVFTPTGAEPSQWAAYQIVELSSNVPSTLFTNGSNLQLFNGGRQVRFFRESPEHQMSYWIADLTN